MKKYFAAILLLSLFVITPVFAQNISIEQIIQAIKADPALLVKIQEALKQLINQPNPVGNCYQFDKDLTRGSTGNDVRSLVRLLKPEISADYTQFNDNVFAWVKDFQAKNGVPNTGYVGPLTRAKLNLLYGCSGKIFITPNALEPMKVRTAGEGIQQQTLKAHGFAPGSNLTWSVVSGSVPPGVYLQKETIACPAIYPSTCTSTETFMAIVGGWPSAPGTYTFTVQATDGSKTASQTYTLVVIDSNQPKVTVISPNGGESWVAKSVKPITWVPYGCVADGSPCVIPKVDLYLNRIVDCGVTCMSPSLPNYVLDKNIPWNTTYNWIVGTDVNDKEILPGNYVVKVCLAGSATNCDSSDQAFTITDSNQAKIAVTSPKAGDKWETYTTQNISWSYPGASASSKIDLYLDGVIYCITTPCNTPDSMKYLLDKNIAANTSYNWIVGTDVDNKVIPPANYTVRICKAGTTECSSSGQFNLSASTRVGI